MILSPREKRSYRLIIIGEKRLPAMNGGGDRKTWGFVEKVAGRAEEVEDELDPETYRTKTHGKRLRQAVPLDETRRAVFPKHLQDRFHGHCFISVDPPEFLDYTGAEILLVGAKQDVFAEPGVDLNPEHETQTTAEIFNDLKLERSLHSLTPMFKGKWE
jgi:hypothetical protein